MRIRIAAVALNLVVLSVALAAEPVAAQPDRFGDGTVRVGIDVPPGIYMTVDPLRSRCHIALSSGGRTSHAAFDPHANWRPEVSLYHGDQFASRGCGTWAKIG